MKSTFKSIAINYGMYLGIVTIILTGIGYAIDLELFVTPWFGILYLISILTFGIISILKSKNALGGYIDFKDAFTAFFITLVVGLIIKKLIDFFIFYIIDPDAEIVLRDKLIDLDIARMEANNDSIEKIEASTESYKKSGNMYSPLNLFKSLISKIGGFSIVGLLAAAILKKTQPQGK